MSTGRLVNLEDCVREPCRVVLCERDSLMLRGMRSIVELATGEMAVTEATDLAEASALIRRENPSVVLLGAISFADKRLTDLTRLGCPVILLIDEKDISSLIEGTRAGVCGFLDRNMAVEELEAAVAAVTSAHAFLSPSVARNLLDWLTVQLPDAAMLCTAAETLSNREHEVLRMLGDGRTDDEIAVALKIGKTTVRSHVQRITSKLQLASRVQTAVFGSRYFFR